MCRALYYLEHFFIFISAISGWVTISEFASLVVTPADITSSARGLKFCVLTAAIKKYKSIIKEKQNRHNNIVFLAKNKLDYIKVFITKALIDSYISHDNSVSVNIIWGWVEGFCGGHGIF